MSNDGQCMDGVVDVAELLRGGEDNFFQSLEKTVGRHLRWLVMDFTQTRQPSDKAAFASDRVFGRPP